ncbi:MAG: sulfite exporter TauE/SafE family protein [Bacteroidetes bacterium]|nr:MAG: sulfite exporter TauE/SafE family protein [Bacteroidota bacterium]
MEVLGYMLAILVGMSLGLVGSGGAILTVPILVYILGVNPVLATAYSLFIVGSTALIGGIQSALQKQVHFRTVLLFGIPSMLAVYATRKWLLPLIPAELLHVGGLTLTKAMALMLLFAVVMMAAAISMIRPGIRRNRDPSPPGLYNYVMLLLQGSGVGIIAGLVGAGGGFLIIPALVLLARMPMKMAVGTSLFIIASNSLLGFTGDLQGSAVMDWRLLTIFTSLAVTGIFLGILLSKKVPGAKLKTGLGWFVLVIGFYIILKETLL